MLSTDSLQLAVKCKDVTKAFGDGADQFFALRGVNMSVYPGQMNLLVGQSGCGKTTLISVIAGLLEPTAGQVAVLGTELGTLSGRGLVQFRARNIGFVFQQYNLLPALTAAENAAVPLLIAGWSRPKAVAKAKELLDLMSMGDKANSLPNQLSGGQQQRVAIARALVHEPRLLVCDEPTAALDAKSGRTVMELLRKVAVQVDRTVIIVTHDNRVFDFADRIFMMEDGRIESVVTPAEVAGQMTQGLFAH
ncbi:MAG TPA: ABC transporter ATP-binding protein [Gemmatales bacterium]|nr:ABC transporter ATP-binding protein [Gemmatales bacterium]HMP59404.1 ABC transporter ATP-binding protein [Gemmatales bacterium]